MGRKKDELKAENARLRVRVAQLEDRLLDFYDAPRVKSPKMETR